MADVSFKQVKAHEILRFCGVVQACAVGMTVTIPPASSLFLHHLTGFTIWLQGAVILSGGSWWCLHQASERLNPGEAGYHSPNCLIWLSGCAGASAGTSALYAYGSHLPGVAGELPFTVQLAGLMSVIAISLYVVILQRRNLRVRQELITAHQTGLTQRLRHHFLFNALNTTVCLISVRPDVASNNLVDLSQLFRLLLKQKPMITLMEEIEFVRCYIRIENARLGERLSVEWNLPDGDVLREEVPSMVIQPLVENAIYHGVEASCDGCGAIRITIRSRRDRIFFDIRNPVGSGFALERFEGNHLAQRSVNEKLFCIYGEASRLDCQQGCGEYRAAFSIPRNNCNEHIDRR